MSLRITRFSATSLPQPSNAMMQKAVDWSDRGVNNGGGPFGAVIVDQSGKIIGQGYNRVALDNDPIAHGEISAIRDAGKNLGSFDLANATLYTSTYPCPMCFSAAHWANIVKFIMRIQQLMCPLILMMPAFGTT